MLVPRSRDCALQNAPDSISFPGQILELKRSFLRSPINMATETPPPYFPQGSLSPPDEGRYRKFKLAVAAAIVAFVLLLGAALAGAWYLLKWIF